MQLGVASAMSLRTDSAINESKMAVTTMMERYMTTDPQTFVKELLCRLRGPSGSDSGYGGRRSTS
eukprot:5775111-Amphidinium_carterae.1